MLDGGGLLVERVRGGGMLRLEVQHDAGSGPRRLGADRLHAEGVRHQEMMGGRERRFGFRPPRGVRADAVPVVGDDVRLVQRREMTDPVAQPTGHECRELAERIGCRTDGPSAGVLQGLGKVPVVEGDERVDAAGEELVDEAVVEGEARFVGATRPLRQHPGPGDREPVGAQTEIGHERDVLAIPVVVIAGDVAGVAVPHPPRRVGEPIPDALSATVLVDGPFDLIRGGRRPPDEAGRELTVGH